MGHLARGFRLSGPTHGRPPCYFHLSPRYTVPVVPDIASSPECLASELYLVESDLPALANLSSVLPELRLTR
jgi:hypothetical protein